MLDRPRRVRLVEARVTHERREKAEHHVVARLVGQQDVARARRKRPDVRVPHHLHSGQICQEPPRSSGTSPPSSRRPVTSTSLLPIMKSMWISLRFTRG